MNSNTPETTATTNSTQNISMSTPVTQDTTASATVTNEENPKVVYVHGMPLALRGFNGTYIRKGDDDSWERKERMCMTIPIRPTSIVKKDNKWVLQTEDWQHVSVCESDHLLGRWDGLEDIMVTDAPSWKGWWCSNSYYVYPWLALAVAGAAFYARKCLQ